jgi:hypothetical protein
MSGRARTPENAEHPHAGPARPRLVLDGGELPVAERSMRAWTMARDRPAAKDFRFFARTGLTISADLSNAPNQRTTLASTDEWANGNFSGLPSCSRGRFGG